MLDSVNKERKNVLSGVYLSVTVSKLVLGLRKNRLFLYSNHMKTRHSKSETIQFLDKMTTQIKWFN
jgi:hypothetical protein